LLSTAGILDHGQWFFSPWSGVYPSAAGRMAEHRGRTHANYASWLNQVEIYFSILQRKVLTPNDFASLEQLQDRILQFEKYYEQAAQPFKWKFTRRDLDNLLRKIETVRTDKSEAA